MKQPCIVCGLALFLNFSPASFGAAIFWSGGGDGISWNDTNNWSNQGLPAAADDAIVSGISTNVTLKLGSDVTLRSLQCSASLMVAGGNLSVTTGASYITGNFGLASGRSLNASGPDTTFAVGGQVRIDGGSLGVSGGAKVVLSNLTSYVADYYGSTWQASGAGSLIDARSVTNLVGSYYNWLSLQAQKGGQLILSGVRQASGLLELSADGAGSQVNLSGLAGAWPTDQVFPGRGSVDVSNGGAVLIPNVTALRNTTVYVRTNATLATHQLTQMSECSITIPEGTPDFGSLTNCDGSSWYVTGGAHLVLSNLTSYMADYYGSTWQASGAGSLLDVRSLTHLVGSYYNWFSLQAQQGGGLDLSGVRQASGHLLASADGADSQVGLPGLAGTWPTDQERPGAGSLDAGNGGAVLIPNVTALRNTTIYVRTNATLATHQLTQMSECSITIPEGTPGFGSLTNCDGSSWYVSGGAHLVLSNLTSYVADFYGSIWQASGAGSLIDARSVTNLVGSYYNWLSLQAQTGGLLNLDGVRQASGHLQASADGPGSQVDLSGLAGTWPTDQERSGAGSLDVGNGSAVLMPNVTALRNTSIYVRTNATLATHQLTQMSECSITIPEGTPDFGSLTNCDGSSWYVSGGAHLVLSNLTSYVADYYGSTWQAIGAGTLLDVRSVTNLVGSYYNWLSLQAQTGGLLNLDGVRQASGHLQASADGPGSQVDLSGLAGTWPTDQERPGAGSLDAGNGGAVLIPNVTALSNTYLYTRTNATLAIRQLRQLSECTVFVPEGGPDFGSLTNCDGSSWYVSGGAHLVLSNLTSYVADFYGSIWQASGAGSLLDVRALTNLVGSYYNWLSLQAQQGGQLNLSGIYSLQGQIDISATGPGSKVDGAGASNLVTSSGTVQFSALGGGELNLGGVRSISGSSTRFLADGAGSVLDLSSLSAFATPLGPSAMTAQNGGTILLSANVFLLVNVAVSFAGNPVLPPVVSAGPSVSVYGRAWHSYWVDVRDTRLPDGPWRLFRRVAQTNDLQIIADAPAPWQAFRVYEFIADPAILEISLVEGQSGQLLLFGRTNLSFMVQTNNGLAAPGAWGYWGVRTGPMTNSFRFLPSIPMPDARQYFRSKQEVVSH